MTEAEQKTLLIWGGAGLAVVILAWFLLDSESYRKESNKAETAYGKYEQLYPESGEPVDDVLTKTAEAANAQAAALETAKQALIGQLPEPYHVSSYEFCLDQVERDITHLQTRADSDGIGLPRSIPFQGVPLSQDPATLRRSMAEIYFMRTLLDMLFDVHPQRIDRIDFERGAYFSILDKSVSGLVMSVEYQTEYPGLMDFLDELREANSKGLGLHRIELGRGNGEMVNAVIVVSLLLEDDPTNSRLGEGSKAGPAPTQRRAAPPASRNPTRRTTF